MSIFTIMVMAVKVRGGRVDVSGGGNDGTIMVAGVELAVMAVVQRWWTEVAILFVSTNHLDFWCILGADQTDRSLWGRG